MARRNLEDRFRERTRLAREAAGMTQEQMAAALDIEKDTYAKYENRSPLPFFLIERFCLIARVPIAWLLTGRGEAQPGARIPRPRKAPAQPAYSHKAS